MNTLLLVTLMVGALALFTANAKAQAAPQERQNDVTAPLEPLPAGVTGDELFAFMTARNDLRSAALRDHAVSRTYEVVD